MLIRLSFIQFLEWLTRLANFRYQSLLFVRSNVCMSFQTTIPDEKEITNCKSLFNPKPFKDASFWFIKSLFNRSIKFLLLCFCVPGLLQKEKQTKRCPNRQISSHSIRYFLQITINLKLMEVKLELGSGSRRKSVIAICLSNLFADVNNWSSDVFMSYEFLRLTLICLSLRK